MEPGNRKILLYQPIYAWLIVAMVIVLLGSGGYLLFQRGIHYAGTEWLELKGHSDVLIKQSQEVREQNTDLRQQIAVLARSSEIDRLASDEVRNEFAVLQDKMLALREELAFYRGIVSPMGSEAGLQIQRFNLQAETTAGHYRYRLMLTQVKTNEKYVRGIIEITVEGMEEGEKQVKSLSLLTTGDKVLKFKFRYFQEFEGQMVIPEGFLPERITIKVLSGGKGKPSDVEKIMEWPR